MSVLPMGRLPCAPRADRILVKPYPVEEENGLILLPKESQKFRNGGWILAAGLMALDQMRDHGDEIGDEVLWGQFAGVWEEWDHLVETGKEPGDCGSVPQEHKWGPRTCPAPKTERYVCETCGAVRLREPVWLMNVEDLLGNISLEERKSRGAVSVVFETANGQNQHVLKRSQP